MIGLIIDRKHMDRKHFEKIVNDGIASVPNEFLEKLQNVAIIIENEPSADQISKLHLQNGFILFGLYEGVPRAKGLGIMPAKITIFEKPIIESARSEEDMKEIVKQTVWHEIAHAFGMDERTVREAERKRQKRKAIKEK